MEKKRVFLILAVLFTLAVLGTAVGLKWQRFSHVNPHSRADDPVQNNQTQPSKQTEPGHPSTLPNVAHPPETNPQGQPQQQQEPQQDKDDEWDELEDAFVPPPATEENKPAKLEKMSSEKFQAESEKFIQFLAQNAGKPATVENGHSAADFVVDGASHFKALVEAVELNPELIPQANGLYRQCATRSSHPSALRALCYLQLRETAEAQASEIQDQLLREIPDLRDLELEG